MRHGEAEGHSPDGDAGRNLTPRGREQAERAGRCLAGLQSPPSRLWASPYRRAQQTAAAVGLSLPAAACETVDFLVPEADPAEVMAALAQAPDDNLMLVSHQPLVGSLVARLAGLAPFAAVPMAPASMVLLTAQDALPGCFDLVWQRHSPDFEAGG